MTKTQEKKRRKEKIRIRRIAVAVTIILSTILIDYYYHRIFYSKADARVIYTETRIVGETGSPWGPSPLRKRIIKIEFTAHDGVKYIAELSISELRYVREGCIVGIRYKNSDPEKCYLD